jgi:hypothetical protein
MSIDPVIPAELPAVFRELVTTSVNVNQASVDRHAVIMQYPTILAKKITHVIMVEYAYTNHIEAMMLRNVSANRDSMASDVTINI